MAGGLAGDDVDVRVQAIAGAQGVEPAEFIESPSAETTLGDEPEVVKDAKGEGQGHEAARDEAGEVGILGGDGIGVEGLRVVDLGEGDDIVLADGSFGGLKDLPGFEVFEVHLRFPFIFAARRVGMSWGLAGFF